MLGLISLPVRKPAPSLRWPRSLQTPLWFFLATLPAKVLSLTKDEQLLQLDPSCLALVSCLCYIWIKSCPTSWIYVSPPWCWVDSNTAAKTSRFSTEWLHVCVLYNCDPLSKPVACMCVAPSSWSCLDIRGLSLSQDLLVMPGEVCSCLFRQVHLLEMWDWSRVWEKKGRTINEWFTLCIILFHACLSQDRSGKRMELWTTKQCVP